MTLTATDIGNIVYTVVAPVLEGVERGTVHVGNGHHAAQEIVREVERAIASVIDRSTPEPTATPALDLEADVRSLRAQVAELTEQCNAALTDSDAFRAGFVEGAINPQHPDLDKGWGGLDALLERRTAPLRAQICRLVSGQALDSDLLCQHHDADIKALAERDEARAELVAARAEIERLTALRCDCDEESGLHAPTCMVMVREQNEAMTAEIARLTAELAAARAVPADVEAAIDAYGCDAAMHGALGADATTRKAVYAAIARAIVNAKAAPPAPRRVGEVLATEPAARPLDEWHEDFGPALWWRFPIEEPPYCGSPPDDDWPGYHTHWTPIVCPIDPSTRGPIGGEKGGE